MVRIPDDEDAIDLFAPSLAKGEIRSQLILAINVNDVVNGVLFAQKWQAYNKHFRSLLVVILLSRSIWRCQ